jgi:L-ascorbate metabolism protein UlaG (beta-lactamase superfamily)
MMIHERHRMIYYQPDVESDELPAGTLHNLGKTTVLIDYGQLRVLVDPFAGNAGVPVPCDALVQAASGRPRLDRIREQAIDREVPVITTPTATGGLEQCGFENVLPLETWHDIALISGDACLTITALPGNSGHGTTDSGLMSTMFELRCQPDATPYRLFLTGGACATESLKEIASRFPWIDLAVIALPYTRPEGSLVAMDGGEAVEIVRHLRPLEVVPIHRHDDVTSWPLRAFQVALRRSGIDARVHEVAPGETLAFHGIEHPTPLRLVGAPRV